jgi:hypothetical protein
MADKVKLTDSLLAQALKAGHIEDKQTKIAKGAVKENLYSFPTVFLHLQKAGCTVKESAVRQRIYAVNKALAEAGVKQKWVAKRDFTGPCDSIVGLSCVLYYRW